VLQNFREIEPAVRGLVKSGSLYVMKDGISKLDNRAVFEIPAMLDRILTEHQAGISGQECLG
jgi:hypothetical protein